MYALALEQHVRGLIATEGNEGEGLQLTISLKGGEVEGRSQSLGPSTFLFPELARPVVCV